MGIDLHNLNFLAHAADRGVRFGQTIAIGRQALFIEDRLLERHRQLRGLEPIAWPQRSAGAPTYFEPLLEQWFGAAAAHSVDASPYEHASVLHDMNLPWDAAAPEIGRYDAVLDFGCLEHVFNFPVAWRNCIDLCRVGGHVLHSLPANNLAGHGFYQFSPELFFNLYRRANGFELLDLFFAVKADTGRWWRVANPSEVKRRVNLCNSHEVYLLVLANKREQIGALPAPQQSDYAQGDWLQPGAALPAQVPGWRQRAVDALARLGAIDAARNLRERLRALGSSGFALPAPDYQRVDIDALLRRR